MAYVYSKVDDLEQTDKVGSRQCVALVQKFALAPHTSLWRAGTAVMENGALEKGTAIATFVKGRYLSHRHGNHAALFVRHDAGGIWVMDQWADDIKKEKVSQRFIRSRGKRKDGSYADPVENADAYSVIEN